MLRGPLLGREERGFIPSVGGGERGRGLARRRVCCALVSRVLLEEEDEVADGFRGAIFDVDGVLVDSPHE